MRFYKLAHPDEAVDDALTDYRSAWESNLGESPRCPTCGDIIGMKPDLPPIRVELETWGRRFGDLAFGVSNEVLVSQRFKEAFQASGLTGFSPFLPAQVVRVIARRGRVPNTMPNYFLAAPSRSRALIDDRASGIEYQTGWTCEECRGGVMKRLRRIVLEPNTWSGEDVFVARGLPGSILASERFKAFCDRHAFTNCLLIEAGRHRFDHFPWEHAQ